MKYSKVRDVKSPERGTSGSAGIDFFIPNDLKDFGEDITVQPHTDLLIPSGVKAEIPSGHMLMAADKSGIATTDYAQLMAGKKPKSGAFESPLIIGAKIVDEDFQGEIFIHLINVGEVPVVLHPGMKIAQFIVVPVNYERLTEVPEDELFARVTERGEGCLGSQGRY